MMDYAVLDKRSAAAALRGKGDYRVAKWERYAQQFKPQDMERAMLSYPQYCAEQVRQRRLNREVDQAVAMLAQKIREMAIGIALAVMFIHLSGAGTHYV